MEMVGNGLDSKVGQRSPAVKRNESLMVTNMIPLYHYCTYSLAKSLENFDQSDDDYGWYSSSH
jgi:hypothetical protein